MSNLPKYYFGDIPAEVMKQIMDEMLHLKPEPRLEDVEEADDWLNRHNVARTTLGPATMVQLIMFVQGFLTVELYRQRREHPAIRAGVVRSVVG